MKKIIFSLLFVFGSVFAEELSFNVTAEDYSPAINEETLISIELNKKAKNIVPPKGNDYSVTYAGLSQSSQVTIINGKLTSKQSYVYNFIFVPKKAGKIELPPFKIEIDKVYETQPIIFNVVKTAKRQKRKDPFSQLEELIQPKIIVPRMGLKLFSNKERAFQNEQIILDLYLYSDKEEALSYGLKEINPLRTDKAICYEIPVNSNPQKEGAFYKKLIKRFVLYPIDKGLLAIAPPLYVAITPYGQLEVKGENIGIDVNSFKEFSYIGELNASISVNTNIIKTGEVLKITLTLKGNGNLKIFSNLYENLKIDHLFISRKEGDLKFSEFNRGKAYFINQIDFEIIPDRDGEYTIPSLEIKYYSDEKIQKKIKLPEIKFKVSALTLSEDNLPQYRVVTKFKSNDIIVFHPLVIIIFFLMFLLPFGAYGYSLFKKKFETDIVFRKKILANKKLDSFLKEAKDLLAKNDYKSFYLSLSKTIFYYLTYKYNLSASLSFKEIINELSEKVDENILENLKEKYYYCQKAYSINIDKTNANKIYDEVQELLSKI